MRIKIKNSDTFVILEGYSGAVESHPILTDFPDQYELTTDEPTESSNYFVCTYKGDPRKAPDYYLVREAAGKALVNEVANELLIKYKSGELTLAQVMDIEQILDNTMSALGRGQIISALFHIGNVSGIDATFKASIATRIDALKLEHYA